VSSDRRCVLDASAVLALLHGETGADVVEREAERAAVSAVNWSEICHRLLARGISIDGVRDDIDALGIRILSFGADDAEEAAALWPRSRRLGLSLGDRACVALALRLGLPAVTADGSWSKLDLEVEVRAIR
jgi:ribonuclease VapC